MTNAETATALLMDTLEERIDYLMSLIIQRDVAIDIAAHKLYIETGSCPSHEHNWEHSATCVNGCKRIDEPDGEWRCWRLWLMLKAKEEYKQ